MPAPTTSDVSISRVPAGTLMVMPMFSKVIFALGMVYSSVIRDAGIVVQAYYRLSCSRRNTRQRSGRIERLTLFVEQRTFDWANAHTLGCFKVARALIAFVRVDQKVWLGFIYRLVWA
jgi:hypothetical protein